MQFLVGVAVSNNTGVLLRNKSCYHPRKAHSMFQRLQSSRGCGLKYSVKSWTPYYFPNLFLNTYLLRKKTFYLK